MHWLFDLLLEFLFWLIPWGSHHEDRSIVGASRMDRQARIIAWVVISVVIVGVLTFYFITTK